MKKYGNWILAIFLIGMVSLNCSGQDRTSHKRQRICLKGYNVAMGELRFLLSNKRKAGM